MRLLGLLFAAALLVFPAAARADDAGTLLAKHRAYTGWRFNDADAGRQDVTETISSAGGKPITQVHTLRVGAIFRADTHNIEANSDFSRGFTGNVFWYADQNGFVVPIIGDRAKLALAEDLFFSDGVGELPWRITGSAQKWSGTYDVVRVQQASAVPVDLYVDPQTGAYAGATFDPGGDQETTVQVLAYKQLSSGKRVIAKWKRGGSNDVAAIASITTAASITNDQLHPPQATASWVFANSNPFPIQLTNTRIIVKARVNGVEGRFILDSGASDIFLSGEFARRVGLKALGHASARTLYGKEKTDVGQADLEIGGNTLHNVRFYFGQRELDDSAPDGLLGFGLLAAAFVTVDFQHSTMQIQDPNAVNSASIPGVHVAVDLSSGQPVTPMGVQQKTATVNALLDTGSPRVILIDARLPGTYGLHMTSAGVLGGCGLLDNMTLGPIVYDHPNACTMDNFGLHNALLGYDFPKGLGALDFDYAHSGMILVPRAKQ